MSLESDLCLLKAIPLFLSLPPARLKLVALMGERLHYEAGSVIVAEGEKPDGVYFVLSGEVELRLGSEEGLHKSYTLGTGGIIGDISTLCDQRLIGRVIASSEVSMLRLPQQLFFELLETIPEFAVALSRDLASRLHRLGSDVFRRIH